MYWLYFVRKLSYYFKKRLGLTLKTSDEGGGGEEERQRLNELKLFVERIVEKNGEKLWSFGYGTRQKNNSGFFLDLWNAFGNIEKKGGKMTIGNVIWDLWVIINSIFSWV